MRMLTKLAGVTFENRQEHINEFNPKCDTLLLKRDAENAYDENAVLVTDDDDNDLGFLPAVIAKEIGPLMDQKKGKKLNVKFGSFNTSTNSLKTGMTVLITDEKE